MRICVICIHFLLTKECSRRNRGPASVFLCLIYSVSVSYGWKDSASSSQTNQHLEHWRREQDIARKSGFPVSFPTNNGFKICCSSFIAGIPLSRGRLQLIICLSLNSESFLFICVFQYTLAIIQMKAFVCRKNKRNKNSRYVVKFTALFINQC